MPTLMQFENKAVTIKLVDDEPWFLAKDVCVALGYAKPRNAIATHVDEEDTKKMGALTSGGLQQAIYINESGLYALIFGSQLDTAKRFKRWVTQTVLPEIRKTGRFNAAEVPQTYSQALRLAADLADSNKALNEKLERAKPAVEFVERYVNATGNVSLTEAAKTLNQKPRSFIESLIAANYLFRRGKELCAYQRFIDQGLFVYRAGENSVCNRAFQQVLVTAKGINYFAAETTQKMIALKVSANTEVSHESLRI